MSSILNLTRKDPVRMDWSCHQKALHKIARRSFLWSTENWPSSTRWPPKKVYRLKLTIDTENILPRITVLVVPLWKQGMFMCHIKKGSSQCRHKKEAVPASSVVCILWIVQSATEHCSLRLAFSLTNTQLTQSCYSHHLWWEQNPRGKGLGEQQNQTQI